MIPVRYREPEGEGADSRTIAIKELSVGHPLVGATCAACWAPIYDAVALVYVGPGPEREDQERYRAHAWHSGCAAVLHPSCAGVEPSREFGAGEMPPADRISFGGRTTVDTDSVG